MTDYPRHTKIRYIRNEDLGSGECDRHPVGVLYAHPTENGFGIGYSLINRPRNTKGEIDFANGKQDRFNKAKALDLAEERALLGAGVTYDISFDMLGAEVIAKEIPSRNIKYPSRIHEVMQKFVSDCNRYYKHSNTEFILENNRITKVARKNEGN